LTLAIKGNLLTYLVPGALNRPNTVFLLLLLLLLLLMMMMMKMMLMMVVVACWWRGVVAMRCVRSTKLLYAGPGYYLDR